jgi:hypothetical protein
MLATATRTVRVNLPPPHSPGQREMIETPLSMVCFGGARYGKTEGEVRRVVRAMSLDPGLYFWVGLDWPSSSMHKAWRMFRDTFGAAIRAAGKDPARYINLSTHEIRSPNGALLMLRTSKAPEGIAGEGPRGVVGDEFTYWPEEVWTRFVQPSLVDHNAWCHLIGRPAGENWAAQLWRDTGTRAGWLQRRYTIYDNPLLDVAFIEELKDNTPPPIWAQEYMAEPLSGDDGVIPLAFVLAAQDRWRAWDAGGRVIPDGARFVLGLDVSEGGGDLTTFALRWGDVVAEVRDETPRERGDMAGIADKACALLAQHGGAAIVDSIGVGAFLPQAIRRAGHTAVSFKASAATPMRDKAGEFGFANLRAAAWWHLRESLAPPSDVCLPPDTRLTQELTAPRFDVRAGAKIGVEDKDAIRRRIGRSTDKADAVVQSFWDWGARRKLVA